MRPVTWSRLVVRAHDVTTDPRFQAYSDNGEGSLACRAQQAATQGLWGRTGKFVRSKFNPGSSPNELCPLGKSLQTLP